jgi:YD repeat-containing protein
MISIWSTDWIAKPAQLIGGAVIVYLLLTAFTGICQAAETYEYDENNRLVRVYDESADQRFEYDGTGNRIATTTTATPSPDNDDDSNSGCFIHSLFDR